MSNYEIELEQGRSKKTMEEQERLAYLFGSSLPYHNPPHSLRVCQRCEVFLERFAHYGIEVQAKVVRQAAPLHDSCWSLTPDYFWGPTGIYGKTKEQLGAHLAMHYCEKSQWGLPEERKLVGQCIEETNERARVTSPESAILSAADLAGLAGSYAEFDFDWELLRQEAALVRGVAEVDPIAYACGSCNLLAWYLSRKIYYTPEYLDVHGRSIFHVQALANIRMKLATLYNPDLLWVTGEIGDRPESNNVLETSGFSRAPFLHLRIEQNPEIRHQILMQGSVGLSKIGQPIVFALPEEEGAVSVPNGFFNELVCRNCQLSPSALSAVINSPGRLHWQFARDQGHHSPVTAIREFEAVGFRHVRDRISTNEIHLIFEK